MTAGAPTTPVSKSRHQGLDILRAVAVFLVLLRHVNVYGGHGLRPAPVAEFFARGGWIGVDLFFVLSGFLISQLLFKEQKKFGTISFKNFFIRRGFKIYPAYYFMVLVTALILCSWNVLGPKRIFFWSFPWMFYLQDYLQNPMEFIWGHSWSLAAEEQFYLLLPLLLILLTKFGKPKDNPFKAVPFLFLFIAAGCLWMRLSNAPLVPFDGLRHLALFHLRVDSLFCGVFVSYLYHYHRSGLTAAAQRFRRLFLFAGVILALPTFFVPLESSPFVYTCGYTLLYVGFALILAVVVVSERVGKSWAERSAAYIGARSYSVYLWHFPIAWLIYQPQAHLSGVPSGAIYFLYLILSIAFGIILSNSIELPILNLRNKLYPSRST